jgi:MFS family permease
MYQLDWVLQWGTRRGRQVDLPGRAKVSPTVWLLGLTSALTDISSEMVNSILPLYLVGFLRLTPLHFGVIDGLYQGVSAILRILGGVIADRWRRHKETAIVGYGLSAVCKLALLGTANSWTAIATVVALDRTGKGLRTAPRDAMIALTSRPDTLGNSFGVHRALDAAGAMLGPVVAFVILSIAADAFDVVFVGSFGIAVIGLGVLVFFVNPPLTQPVLAAPAKEAAGSIPLLLAPGFGRLVIAMAALSLATMSDAFIYLALQQRLAFPSTVFPLLYVATSLIFVVAAVPAGRIADRIGRRAVLLAGYVTLGLVYVVLLLPTTGMMGVVIGITGLGLYYAATDGVLMAIAGSLLPAERCATGLAVLTTWTSIARLTSSIAFGWLWTVGDVIAAVRVFGIALLLAILVAAVILPPSATAVRRGEQDPPG